MFISNLEIISLVVANKKIFYMSCQEYTVINRYDNTNILIGLHIHIMNRYEQSTDIILITQTRNKHI